MLQPCARLVRLELHPVPVQPEIKVILLSGSGVCGRPPLSVVAPDGHGEVLGLRERLQAEGGHRRWAERSALPARQARVADDLESRLVDRRVQDVLGAVHPERGVSNAEVSHSEIRVIDDDLVVSVCGSTGRWVDWWGRGRKPASASRTTTVCKHLHT